MDKINLKDDDYHPTSLNSLPSETVHHIISYLHSPIDIHRLSLVCKSLHNIASHNVVWRPIVQECLQKSPPIRSENLKSLLDPPSPWQTPFGMISSGRSQATKERWKAPVYGGNSYNYDDDNDDLQEHSLSSRSKGKQKERNGFLSLFKGIQSYHELYWLFVRPFSRLLGWWLGDVPSYGMIIRIIFNPAYIPQQDQNAKPTPAFICQKLHLVNRFYGMGSAQNRYEWRNATGLNSSNISNDGTSIQAESISIDVSLPGVKTEDLWSVTWEDVRKMHVKCVREYKDVAQARWKGADQSHHAKPSRIFDDHGEFVVQPGRSNGKLNSTQNGTHQHNGSSVSEEGVERHQSSRSNADYMELDGLHEFRPGDNWAEYVNMSAIEAIEAGHFNHIPAFKRAIRQRCGNRLHTVYLTSGAVCTAPAKFAEKVCCPDSWSCLDTKQHLSLNLSYKKLFKGPDMSKTGGFGLRLSNFLPLPPIEFPSPALLPLVRDPFEHEDGRIAEQEREEVPKGSSKAFEEFLNFGTDFTLPTLQMEPCPPYRPWPHLSQPVQDGLRFVPIKSPPREPFMPYTKQIKMTLDEQNGHFDHPSSIALNLDPASESFDWNIMQGLFSMTYGPWGQELIYIRSRILTVHDFAPNDRYFNDHHENTEIEFKERPTGPHGLGHRKRGYSSLETDDESGLSTSPIKKKTKEKIEEGLHWQPEPFIDRSDLELPFSQTKFVKPGCRVIEGIKCTGDANVPRGSITFRAFSRGPNEDECIAYFAPDSDQARHPPWDGRQTKYVEADTDEEDEEGITESLLEEGDEEAGVLPWPPTMDAFFRINRRGRMTAGRGRRSYFEQRTNAAAAEARRNHLDEQTQHQSSAALFPPSPGRILDCGTGRLAMEGFVNAGCWRRCSIKIVSADEICVYWQALHKVALAKRLINV